MHKPLLLTATLVLALLIAPSLALSCGGTGGMGGQNGNYQYQYGDMQNMQHMHGQMHGGNGMMYGNDYQGSIYQQNSSGYQDPYYYGQLPNYTADPNYSMGGHVHY
jgi:hypothetical protein